MNLACLDFSWLLQIMTIDSGSSDSCIHLIVLSSNIKQNFAQQKKISTLENWNFLSSKKKNILNNLPLVLWTLNLFVFTYFVCLFFVCLFVCLYDCLFVCHLSLCLSVCQFVIFVVVCCFLVKCHLHDSFYPDGSILNTLLGWGW